MDSNQRLRSVGAALLALLLTAGVCAGQTADSPEQPTAEREPATQPGPAAPAAEAPAAIDPAEAPTEPSRVAALLREWIPDALEGRAYLGLEPWQWVGLLVVLFAAVVADFVLRLLIAGPLGRLTDRYLAKPDPVYVSWAVRPLGLTGGAVVYLGGLHLLGLPEGTALTVLGTAGKLVLIVGVGWAVWAVTDLVAHTVVKRVPAAKRTPFETMLVPLLSKTLKLFIIALALVYVAAVFNIQLLPLLGSLGLAGLAISFAAQDTIKNLFGGLMIFMDRPFKVGERINFRGYDGPVEEIGFRITRLRTLTGHLVTIPNANVTAEPVENIGRRPSIRRIMNVTVPYDTPVEKLREAVEILRGILKEPELHEPIHQYIGEDYMEPRVFFSEFNAASLNLFVIYWFIPPDWWAYMEHAHKLNLRILEEFNAAGIEFAFPTQTLHLAGDPKRELAVRMGGGEISEDSGD